MNTISGLSFYDSLNKMTIGTLVLLLVKDIPSEDDGKSIFLFIVAAFIIGCIFQMIVQFITGNTLLKKYIKRFLQNVKKELVNDRGNLIKTKNELEKNYGSLEKINCNLEDHKYNWRKINTDWKENWRNLKKINSKLEKEKNKNELLKKKIELEKIKTELEEKRNNLKKIMDDLEKKRSELEQNKHDFDCNNDKFDRIKKLYKVNVWLNWTNNSAMIKDAHDRVYKSKEYIQDIDRLYLQAYYRVARNGLLMTIPILEALENFMRNLIFYFILCGMLSLGTLMTVFMRDSFFDIISCEFPLRIFGAGIMFLAMLLFVILFAIFLFKTCYDIRLLGITVFGTLFLEFLLGILLCGYIDNSIIENISTKQYCRLILCVVATFIVCWLRKETQYKIHYLIWEGDYYIRRLDKERNKA